MRGHEIACGDLLRPAIEYTPKGKTRDGLQAALALNPAAKIEDAVVLLGNGSKVTAPDTVPLAVWLAERCAEDLPAALWSVIEAGGDVDTVGAMVGSASPSEAGKCRMRQPCGRLGSSSLRRFSLFFGFPLARPKIHLYHQP